MFYYPGLRAGCCSQAISQSPSSDRLNDKGDTSRYLASSAGQPLCVDGPVVTSLADSGCWTLRSAIEYANRHPGPDTITFDVPEGSGTIVLASNLPGLMESATYRWRRTDDHRGQQRSVRPTDPRDERVQHYLQELRHQVRGRRHRGKPAVQLLRRDFRDHCIRHDHWGAISGGPGPETGQFGPGLSIGGANNSGILIARNASIRGSGSGIWIGRAETQRGTNSGITVVDNTTISGEHYIGVHLSGLSNSDVDIKGNKLIAGGSSGSGVLIGSDSRVTEAATISRVYVDGNERIEGRTVAVSLNASNPGSSISTVSVSNNRTITGLPPTDPSKGAGPAIEIKSPSNSGITVAGNTTVSGWSGVQVGAFSQGTANNGVYVRGNTTITGTGSHAVGVTGTRNSSIEVSGNTTIAAQSGQGAGGVVVTMAGPGAANTGVTVMGNTSIRGAGSAVQTVENWSNPAVAILRADNPAGYLLDPGHPASGVMVGWAQP